MKKRPLKALAALLAILMISLSLFGCSSKGKTLMELDGTKISVNTYQLFLSRMKGTLCSASYYGNNAKYPSFWDTVMDADGTTYNKHFTDEVLNSTKNYLAALYLFDKEGLKLPDSYIEEIDAELEELIENDADGSKNSFNAILSEFGVNYKMLREAYIMEAKIAYLNDHLFGADGSKISPKLIEDYYQANYARFKQVFIYTYALVWDTDENGDDVYYSTTDSKKISYDKTAKTTNKNGEYVKDKNGDDVYFTEEGRIAYDKKNGQRNPVLDSETGYQMTRKYTEAELIAASDYAQQVLEKAEAGNYTLFDSLVDNYSEDEGMSKYANGYYVTADTDYDSPEVIEALFDMKDGEVRRVNSEYGIHIVMRYELEEEGYSKTANSDFFVNAESGQIVFMSELKNYLLSEKLKSYVDMIEIDEELLGTVDMKSSGVNFYY
ncbi:MAG: peptidylprolyl isomerase [Ruminococcaceae bacterium]|nr:peptidylprolyl isomerase [Oscillospiraceae bacterium]